MPLDLPIISRQKHRTLINGETIEFDRLEEKFNALVRWWRRDTLPISNQVKILMHPAHFAIIGIGREALPYIFMDLAAGGGPWFAALEAITQEDPIPAKDAKDASRMREDWLAWGRSHDYLGS